jgi:hypothetical protein
VFSFVDGQLMSKKTAVQQSVLLCRPRRLWVLPSLTLIAGLNNSLETRVGESDTSSDNSLLGWQTRSPGWLKRFWRTPRHTVVPWLSTALSSWLHLQWQWVKRQRRYHIIMNERHCFCGQRAESLVMLVNEFVLSTDLAVQNHRANYSVRKLTAATIITLIFQPAIRL